MKGLNRQKLVTSCIHRQSTAKRYNVPNCFVGLVFEFDMQLVIQNVPNYFQKSGTAITKINLANHMFRILYKTKILDDALMDRHDWAKQKLCCMAQYL